MVEILPEGEVAASRPGPRGTCDSRARQRECRCGGYVRNDASMNVDGTGSKISVDPNCSECMENVVTHLASIYAGSRATKLLTPVYHDEGDAQYDNRMVDIFFLDLPVLAPQRITLQNRAKRIAIDTIFREEKAIRSLARELERNSGRLGGEEAAEIIEASLSSRSLIG